MKMFRVGVVVLLSVFLWPVATPVQSEEPVACCFENPAYQGACVVAPGEGETCDSILEYLNTAGTEGKTYCGSSNVRGGWVKAECPGASE